MCRPFSTPPGMWSSDFLSLRPVNFVCRADDVLCLVTQSCPTLCDPRLLCPWGFSRQEYWSEGPCPPPGNLPDPGMEPTSLMSPALADGFFTTSARWIKTKISHSVIMFEHRQKWLNYTKHQYDWAPSYLEWQLLPILNDSYLDPVSSNLYLVFLSES